MSNEIVLKVDHMNVRKHYMVKNVDAWCCIDEVVELIVVDFLHGEDCEWFVHESREVQCRLDRNSRCSLRE